MPSTPRTSKLHQFIGWTAAIPCALFGYMTFAQSMQGKFDGAAGWALIVVLVGWLARGFIRDSYYAGH